MNLPANIDLTESRDFGDHETGIPFHYDPDYDDYSLMTPKEYDFICWVEGIFGKRRHKTSKYKLFPESNPYNDIKIPIRIPWGSAMNGRLIPWSFSTANNFNERRLDLFNM